MIDVLSQWQWLIFEIPLLLALVMIVIMTLGIDLETSIWKKLVSSLWNGDLREAPVSLVLFIIFMTFGALGALSNTFLGTSYSLVWAGIDLVVTYMLTVYITNGFMQIRNKVK